MSISYAKYEPELVPDLRSDFQRNKDYQAQIERNANTPAVDVYLQLKEKSADLAGVFSIPQPKDNREPAEGIGFITLAEEYGIDTRRLKRGLTPSLSL